MSPRTTTAQIVREVPLLHTGERLADAVPRVIESGLPALPVVDDAGRLAGVFGERELIAAVFPKYLGALRHAGFVPDTLDDAIDKRQGARDDPVGDHMTTEHVDVGPHHSDVQVAEIFLHHRVLIVPVTDDDGRVVGAITRSDFFRALAERFLDRH